MQAFHFGGLSCCTDPRFTELVAAACGHISSSPLGLVAVRHVGSPWTRDQTHVPFMAGGFLSTVPPGKSTPFLKGKKKILLATLWGTWNLSLLTRDRTCAPAQEGGILTTGLSGKSQWGLSWSLSLNLKLDLTLPNLYQSFLIYSSRVNF